MGKHHVEYWKLTWKLYKVLVKWLGQTQVDTRRYLVMSKIFGVRADQVHDYIVKAQRDEDPKEQVKFRVRMLSAVEYAEIQNDLYQISGMGDNREERIVTGTQVLETLVLGLRGWSDNFCFDDGTPVIWTDLGTEVSVEGKRRVMLQNIDKLLPSIRSELAEYIRCESKLGE